MKYPIDPETQALIDADFAAKRGPFALAVLAVYQVSDHYGINCNASMRLLGQLKVKRIVAAMTVYIMDPALRGLSGQEAMAHHAAKTPATLHDEAALEAFSAPLSWFQTRGGAAATEALVRADLEGRTGLFTRSVVMAADLVKFYGPKHFRSVRMAGTLLGQVSLRAQNCTRPSQGLSIRLHVVHAEPELLVMLPKELLAEYLRQSAP